MPLPFFAGLVVGVVALRLYKSDRLHARIKDAGQKLRHGGTLAEVKLRRAAVSGLDALAGSSTRLRDRLEGAPAQGTEPAEAELAPLQEAAATPAKTTAAAKPRASQKKPEGTA
jgi:hypothetical protein